MDKDDGLALLGVWFRMFMPCSSSWKETDLKEVLDSMCEGKGDYYLVGKKTWHVLFFSVLLGRALALYLAVEERAQRGLGANISKPPRNHHLQ